MSIIPPGREQTHQTVHGTVYMSQRSYEMMDDNWIMTSLWYEAGKVAGGFGVAHPDVMVLHGYAKDKMQKIKAQLYVKKKCARVQQPPEGLF